MGLTEITSTGSIKETLVAPRTVTGIIPAAGTTPTAGTGFTYTHTASSGVYVFTFSVAFVNTPVVVVTNTNGFNSPTMAVVGAISTTGFTVSISNTTPTLADGAFNFLAYQVT